MINYMKSAWHKLLTWFGIRKPVAPEQPIDMSFVIMGLSDLREAARYKGSKILPFDGHGKMIPNKDPDIGYKGQILPHPLQPDAKIKYAYINEKTESIRYFDKPQDLSKDLYGWMPLHHYDPQYFCTVEQLNALKEERDKKDILARLEHAKKHYQPAELFDEAIQEIKKVRDLVKGNQND